MDVVVHGVKPAAEHVFVSLSHGAVVLVCAMFAGMVVLQRSERSVQGEVKAHPTTGGTDANTIWPYWPCFFFLLVSLIFKASAFGTDLFPLGVAVLPEGG